MSEKSKLDLIKEKMEKDYGKGIIMSGSSKTTVNSVTTGSISFDKITDSNGIPKGKLVEMFGPESSGKSTIALHIIAEFQKSKKKCLLADYEYSFDKNYALSIGVDVDDLIITQPDTMEDGYNIIYEYIKSGQIGLVVIDSHTAMVPKMRMEGEIGDAKMAPEARINSDALKKIKAELEKNDCTVIGISQLRANIGGMGQGNVSTGGNAWKFYPDMRIKIYKTVDKQNETNETVIEVVKNKCGKPYGKCTIPIAWGIGIDKIAEVLKLAVELNIIKKAGSWYSYGENKLGQGSSTVIDLMQNNNEFYQEIRKKVLDEYSKVKMEVLNENE